MRVATESPPPSRPRHCTVRRRVARSAGGPRLVADYGADRALDSSVTSRPHGGPHPGVNPAGPNAAATRAETSHTWPWARATTSRTLSLASGRGGAEEPTIPSSRGRRWPWRRAPRCRPAGRLWVTPRHKSLPPRRPVRVREPGSVRSPHAARLGPERSPAGWSTLPWSRVRDH